MLFAPIAVEAMKCKEENCEVGVILEYNSLIVLAVNKTIVCQCGMEKNNPFERGYLFCHFFVLLLVQFGSYQQFELDFIDWNLTFFVFMTIFAYYTCFFPCPN